jgi:fructosamine-3-kinase
VSEALLTRLAAEHGGLRGDLRFNRRSTTGAVRTLRLSAAGGRSVLAKVAPADRSDPIEAERDGLAALARTDTVRVPEVLHFGEHRGQTVLLAEWIEPDQQPTNWVGFAEELAALHAWDAGGSYGYGRDNWLGAHPQRNTPHPDWVAFNQDARHGEQLRRARSSGQLDAREIEACEQLIERLGEFLPRNPPPALLHGDLWSGNQILAPGGRVAVIDPAVSVGDGWADIAMMQLFGSPPRSFLDAYSALRGVDEGVDERVELYQLYHLMNHLNLFGRGYASAVLACVRKYVG